MSNINQNGPYITGNEIYNIQQSIESRFLAGDGPFTTQCSQWLEKKTGTPKALLTHSATAALEMAAILLNIQPADEIIMPSYTFVSTANAFVLRGGIPVFIDIRSDTLNIDENLIESAITPNTKAIVVVHYAGVACEMNIIMEIAKRYNLMVVEDAAQGVMAKYGEQYLGTIGHLGIYSFHATKNIASGEGGALLINDKSLITRAEIIREKGTNRSRFLRGEVDKYTWEDIGSSYLPNELTAAFLAAQLESADKITNMRLSIWNKYHLFLEKYEQKSLLTRPFIPNNCHHNAHIYFIILSTIKLREWLRSRLKKEGISLLSHYVPLHSSPAGLRYTRISGELPLTNKISQHLLRLPISIMDPLAEDKVIKLVDESLSLWLTENSKEVCQQ